MTGPDGASCYNCTAALLPLRFIIELITPGPAPWGPAPRSASSAIRRFSSDPRASSSRSTSFWSTRKEDETSHSKTTERKRLCVMRSRTYLYFLLQKLGLLPVYSLKQESSPCSMMALACVIVAFIVTPPGRASQTLLWGLFFRAVRHSRSSCRCRSQSTFCASICNMMSEWSYTEMV